MDNIILQLKQVGKEEEQQKKTLIYKKERNHKDQSRN